MATDLERLVVSLDASITKYEKAMARAVGETKSTTSKIEKEFGGLQAKLDGMFSSFGKGFGPGLLSGLAGGAAAFLSIEGVINQASAAFEKFGQVADLSGRAALNPEFFQAIAFQAGQAGVSIETLGGAMATFAKNSALAAEGHGKLAAQLEFLNPALLESIKLASTQEERFRLVVDALNKTADEAERVAIASAAFGDAGAAIANAFQGGATELDRMIEKAKEMGLVVSDDLIARADELGDQWEANAAIIDTQVKAALVDLGPVIVGLTGLAAQFAATIASGIAGLNNLRAGVLAASREGQAAAGAAAGAAVGGMLNTGMPEPSSLAPSWMGSPNVSGAADVGLGLSGAVAGATPQIEQLNGASQELFQTVSSDLAPAIADLTTDLVGVGAAAGKGGGGGKKGGGGKGAADSVDELIESLKAEKDAIGQSSEENRVNAMLRRAGADATEAQKAEIESLVRAIEQEKAAHEMLKDAMKEFQDVAKGALSGFITDLRNGKSAAEALQNVLNNLINKMLDKSLDMLLNAVFSTGSGSSILKIFGLANGGIVQGGLPKFAGGGIASRAAIFGEAGPEAAVPLPNGRQIPVDLRMSKGASSAPIKMGDITINMEGGAPVAASSTQAAQFGNRVRLAIQRTIVEEQRPGGLLWGR